MFVAAEFALVAVDRSRIDQQVEAGSRRARLVRNLLHRLSFQLAGAQLGITVTSLTIGVLARPTIAKVLEPVLEPVVGAGAVEGVSIVVAFVLATVVQMVLGELFPKGLAIARPEATVGVLGPFLRVYGLIFGPVIRVLNGAANWTVRRLGIEPSEELSHVRSLSELELLIVESAEEGTLGGSASTLLTRSIRFGRKTVADALIPRLSVESVRVDDPVTELVARATATGHSRFPVQGADLDDVRGVVHVRSVHGLPSEARSTTPVSALMVEARAVPETRELEELLADMRRTRQHLFVVVDEYGGTAGIITLEDVVEEIVGEIDDEYDTRPPELTTARAPGEFVLPGTLHPDEVEDATGFVVPDGDYETVAGFMLDRLGHLPVSGEKVEYEGWVLEVVAMDRRRIAEIALLAPDDDEAATDDRDATDGESA